MDGQTQHPNYVLTSRILCRGRIKWNWRRRKAFNTRNTLTKDQKFEKESVKIKTVFIENETMKSSNVMRILIFFLFIIFNQRMEAILLLDWKLISCSLGYKERNRTRGYSLPEQEHKEMNRSPNMAADMRTQGQQEHSYKETRRPR
jgi:hypothetical protein